MSLQAVSRRLGDTQNTSHSVVWWHDVGMVPSVQYGSNKGGPRVQFHFPGFTLGKACLTVSSQLAWRKFPPPMIFPGHLIQKGCSSVVGLMKSGQVSTEACLWGTSLVSRITSTSPIRDLDASRIRDATLASGWVWNVRGVGPTTQMMFGLPLVEL